jgi:hypothetical protein
MCPPVPPLWNLTDTCIRRLQKLCGQSQMTLRRCSNTLSILSFVAAHLWVFFSSPARRTRHTTGTTRYPFGKASGTVLVESVSQSKCITKVFVVVRRVLHAVLSAAPVSTPYGSLMCGAPSQPFRWSMLSAGSKVAAASSTTSTVDQIPSHCLLSVIVF